MSDSGSFYTAGNSPEADIGFYKQLRGYFKADPTRAAWQKKLDEEAKKMKQKQLEEEAKQLKQQLIKHETPPSAPTRQPSRWVSSNGGWTQEQVETDQGLSTPQDRGSPNLSGRLSHMGPSPSEAAEAWQRGDYSLTPNTAAADEAATTSAASETTTEVSMAASEPPNLASPATPHEVVAQPTELLVNSHAGRGWVPKESNQPKAYSPDHPIASLRRWLTGELDRGVAEGLDEAPLYRGKEGDAAARIQAAARGRKMRLKYCDAIQTALVVKSARREVEQMMARMEKASPPREMGEYFTSLSAGGLRRDPSPPWTAEKAAAGAPAPGDFVRAQKARAFSLPNQFMGVSNRELSFRPNTVPPKPPMLPPLQYDKATAAAVMPPLRKAASTAERIKLIHALAQVNAGGASPHQRDVDDLGTPKSPAYVRLARAQHWRRCPACGYAVEHRSADGTAQCGECGEIFRWLAAEHVVPVASLSQLRKETRWQYEEITKACASVTMRDIARLYWLSDWTPNTRSAELKLKLWRCAVAAPLVCALPILSVQASRRNRRLRSEQESIPIDTLQLKLSEQSSRPGRLGSTRSSNSSRDSMDSIELPGERSQRRRLVTHGSISYFE